MGKNKWFGFMLAFLLPLLLLKLPASIFQAFELVCFVCAEIFQKPMLTGRIHSKATLSKTSTLENIFFKTVFFPFAKPVPFQRQYQTKTLRICQLNILLSAPAALWPWPKFYQGPPCVSCTLAVAPWPCLHPAGLLLMVLRW